MKRTVAAVLAVLAVVGAAWVHGARHPGRSEGSSCTVARCFAALSMTNSSLTAEAVLAKVKGNLEGVKDYSVRAVMSVDSPTVHVRESRFRVYYKKPDKLRIEPEGGFALVPRGTFLGSAFEQITKTSDLSLAGEGKMEGKACWLVRAVPKERAPDAVEFTLWIEKARGLILASRSEPAPDAKIEVRWKYTRVDGKYWLPSRIDADIKGLPAQLTREHGPFVQTSGKASGKVAIRFTDYRVNRGIPESVFRRSEER